MWFRSWLLLFVLWSSFGHAQYVVDLAQAGPVEVPAGLHIDSVFAAFNDSASMGTVMKGTPARPAPVLLAGGVASAVQGLLRNELPTAGTVHAVMRINALHTGEMAIGHGERGACGLNFELLQRMDSGWARIFDHAATAAYLPRKDLAGSMAKGIAAAFTAGFAKYAQAALAGKLSRMPLSGWPQAGISDAAERRYAVHEAHTPARGIYHSFQDFRDQRPDTTFSFTLKPVGNQPLVPMAKLKVERDVQEPEGIWGLSDGRNAYIQVGDRFLGLRRKEHVFTSFYPGGSQIDPAAMAVGMAFGLVGALLYSAANAPSGAPVPVELDMLTGALRLMYDGSSPAAAEVATSDHLFLYSRHCPMDTTVDMFVYGGLEASLRKENYHRLNLVPRPDAVPVEFNVGAGEPVGIDIRTERIGGEPTVYLIKVDKAGTVKVDRLNTTMAAAVLDKLDPAQEVK